MKAFKKVLLLFLILTPAFGARKNIVFLVGERFNSTTQTMPALAVSLEDKFKFKTTYIAVPKHGEVEGIDALKKADLLVMYLHLRNLPSKQKALINKYLESGKPALAFRSTNQAFEEDYGWFHKYFGGAFRGSVEAKRTDVAVNPELIDHPILNEFENLSFTVESGVILPGPLGDRSKTILMGKSRLSPAFPVAWTYEYKKDQRLFYTSLGKASHFKNPQFLKMIDNAIHWCMKIDKPVESTIAKADIPPAPEMDAPKKSVILFNGKNLNSWKHWDLMQKPRSIDPAHEIEKYAIVRNYRHPRWKVEGKTVVSRPSFGDIITKHAFSNYILSLDFYIPEEPEGIPQDMRGRGGVFLSGRYEIKIMSGQTNSASGPLSIFGVRKPDHVVNVEPGKWHNLKIHYNHLSSSPAEISVILNGSSLHGKIKIKKPTPYGILEPITKANPEEKTLYTASNQFTAEKLKMGDDNFSVSARFKTTSSRGTVFARTSQNGGWERDGKAFFIGSGTLYYDIGWKGIIHTTKKINDGKWHHAVLTHDRDMCIMYLDGKVSFMKKSFKRPDDKKHVFKIGYAFKNYFNPFDGEISNVRYYSRQLSFEEAISLSKDEKVPEGAVLDWRPEPNSQPVNEEVSSRNEPLKGPIRLHGDFSKIRYANIWIKEK